MRFTRGNWNKFFDGCNKITTIRLKRHRAGNHVGHHNAWAGSYNKPKKLGTFDIVKVVSTHYKELNDNDAILDGFSDIVSLREELERLNGKIADTCPVYIHYCANVKKEEVNPYV